MIMDWFRKLRGLSWMFTLTVSILFFIWLFGTWQSYYTFGVSHKGLLRFGLKDVGALQIEQSIGRVKESLRGRVESQLPVIELYIPSAQYSALHVNLPHSGFNYVEGAIRNDGKLEDVKIRYRGDNGYHWGFEKKSLRIKTKKKSLFRGFRRFNLIAPRTGEILNNYLSLRLGSLMGIACPKVELVRVSINNEDRGVYILTEQLEEMTLRRHGFMPGDLYAGEVNGVDQYLVV